MAKDPLELTLSPELRSRFKVLKLQGMNDEQFLDHLLNVALGFHCPHTHVKPYYQAAVNSKGYLDMDRTLTNLSHIRQGKQTSSLVLLCTDCLTAKRVQY